MVRTASENETEGAKGMGVQQGRMTLRTEFHIVRGPLKV